MSPAPQFARWLDRVLAHDQDGVLSDPDRKALANVVKRLVDAKYPLDGASDHGVSEAVYLTDPDGNGVELYRDRDEADWPRDGNGDLAMTSGRLDLRALLAEAD